MARSEVCERVRMRERYGALGVNHPPTSRLHNPRFAGRDWSAIAIGELISEDDVRWVDMDTSVEDATMVSRLCLPAPLSRTCI